MTTYVLVPGGWHGGWDFDPVTERLRAAGHDVRPVTLAGLGKHDAPQTAAANLDTHIEQVVDLLRAEDLTGVHLCGHSYGGMVIAGVADRVPERIDRLVHIDAWVPDDGDSCWSLVNDDYRARFVAGAAVDGRIVAVPPGLDPRARPHPVASFLQAVRLTGAHRRVPRRTLVHCSGWPNTPLTAQYERLRADPGWDVHVIDSGHNVMAERPDDLVTVLTTMEA
jgi:pimeloyl-ACP methyl ester carboxylesterase